MSLAEFMEMGDFVAVDSSTTSIAFAYVHKNKIVKYGKMKFDGHGIYEKVSDIARKTEGLLRLMPVDTLVIEASFYSNNPKTSTNLAIAQGAILGAGSVMGVKNIGSVIPIQWQNGIGNKAFSKDEKLAVAQEFPGKSAGWYQNKVRNLRKQRTIDYVNDKYGLAVDDNDVADALGIAAFVANNRGKVNWG